MCPPLRCRRRRRATKPKPYVHIVCERTHQHIQTYKHAYTLYERRATSVRIFSNSILGIESIQNVGVINSCVVYGRCALLVGKSSSVESLSSEKRLASHTHMHKNSGVSPPMACINANTQTSQHNRTIVCLACFFCLRNCWSAPVFQTTHNTSIFV